MSCSNLTMFIIVNSQLSKSMRIAHAAHAATQYCLTHPACEALNKWNNSRMVVLKDMADIQLTGLGMLKYAQFYDADLGGMWTATAFEPTNNPVVEDAAGRISLA